MTDNAPIWASCATCGEDRFPIDEAMIKRASMYLRRNTTIPSYATLLDEVARGVLKVALEVTE